MIEHHQAELKQKMTENGAISADNAKYREDNRKLVAKLELLKERNKNAIEAYKATKAFSEDAEKHMEEFTYGIMVGAWRQCQDLVLSLYPNVEKEKIMHEYDRKLEEEKKESHLVATIDELFAGDVIVPGTIGKQVVNGVDTTLPPTLVMDNVDDVGPSSVAHCEPRLD